ncbi:hypothetical protein [Alteromonas mediterranea]|uniref:hypothetical protein n=1 Tax=Alteromonas mediterranea TaxID=314275 RepID=UPI001E36B2C5|nr:hypothetical protein [Alteromonas mediterranea]
MFRKITSPPLSAINSRLLVGLYWLSVGLFFSATAGAEQLKFKKAQSESGVLFSYEWLDMESTRQSISFELPHTAIKAAPTQQANYRPKIAQRYVTVALMEAAKKINPKEARVKIIPKRDSIDIQVKGANEDKVEAILSNLKAVQQEAYNAYLDEHYFTRFTTLFNQKAIKPDHTRYATESVKPLVAASQAFYEKVNAQSDSRAYFSLILSWLQSIPYDTLEDRVVSNGSGYAPPINVLMQNVGDCDSKAVLASSMVRAFLPSTKMIMVFLPNHALLGIALTPMVGDRTIVHDGETYVLYDPTGPALIPFGQVSEDTERYIVTGRYQVEAVD